MGCSREGATEGGGRTEEEGGKVKHCSIQLAADKEDDDDDDASLRLRGG